MFEKAMRDMAARFNKASGLPDIFSMPVSPSKLPAYHRVSTNERIAFDEQVKALGALLPSFKAEFKRHELDEDPILDRFIITDCAAFLAHFNIEPLYLGVTAAREKLIRKFNVAPDWLSDTIDALSSAWANDKTHLSLSYKDIDKVVDALNLIAFNESRDQRLILDYRTLSVTLYQDSKRLEAISRTIAKLYGLKPELSGSALDHEEILAYFGISKFPGDMMFKGNVEVRTPAGILSAGRAWPYLSLPPEGIEDISVVSPPSYILFIENKTTFRRFCREINDKGIIIYTNGFPSRSWVPLFSKIIEQTDCPCFHWSDIDLGGYRILAFMLSHVSPNILPYMMMPEISADDGLSPDDLIAIIDTLPCPQLDDIKTRLQRYANDKRYVTPQEQESLDIIPPV